MTRAAVTRATAVAGAAEAAAAAEAAFQAPEAGLVRRNYKQTQKSTTLPRSQFP